MSLEPSDNMFVDASVKIRLVMHMLATNERSSKEIKLLLNSLDDFINGSTGPLDTIPIDTDNILSKDEIFKLLIRNVGYLDISTRLRYCFSAGGIDYIYQLVQSTDFDLMEIKNFGKVCLLEVKKILALEHIEIGYSISSECQGQISEYFR